MEEQELTVQTILGMTATDCVTGLRGTITGVAMYLHGFTRCQIDYIDLQGVSRAEWFEFGRLEMVSPD